MLCSWNFNPPVSRKDCMKTVVHMTIKLCQQTHISLTQNLHSLYPWSEGIHIFVQDRLGLGMLHQPYRRFMTKFVYIYISYNRKGPRAIVYPSPNHRVLMRKYKRIDNCICIALTKPVLEKLFFTFPTAQLHRYSTFPDTLLLCTEHSCHPSQRACSSS